MFSLKFLISIVPVFSEMVHHDMRSINMKDMEFGVNKILLSKKLLNHPVTNIQLD